MVKVSLALARRPAAPPQVVEPGDPAPVGREPGDLSVRFGAQLASVLFALAVFGARVRDGPPPPPARALRDPVADAALALLVLAAWTQLLTTISRAVGIATPSNAFFVIAFAFLLLLLLHFSAAVSRLADETRILAQRLALLEERQRREGDEEARMSTQERPPATAGAPARGASATAAPVTLIDQTIRSRLLGAARPREQHDPCRDVAERDGHDRAVEKRTGDGRQQPAADAAADERARQQVEPSERDQPRSSSPPR